MGKPVEQGRRHLLVTKDARPLSEAEVGRNDDAGALVEFADQMEQQRPAGLAERQIAKLVQDHQIGVYQAICQPPLLHRGQNPPRQAGHQQGDLSGPGCQSRRPQGAAWHVALGK